MKDHRNSGKKKILMENAKSHKTFLQHVHNMLLRQILRE